MEPTDARRLEQLEADVASVASAMETVDRIVAEATSGEAAASEIAAVVSPERFPLDPTGAVIAGEAGAGPGDAGDAGPEGADRDLADRDLADRDGSDRWGSDRWGSDRWGSDREGSDREGAGPGLSDPAG
jgi:purine nucleoside permease